MSFTHSTVECLINRPSRVQTAPAPCDVFMTYPNTISVADLQYGGWNGDAPIGGQLGRTPDIGNLVNSWFGVAESERFAIITQFA